MHQQESCRIHFFSCTHTHSFQIVFRIPFYSPELDAVLLLSL